MQEIRRKSPAGILQLISCRAQRLLPQAHGAVPQVPIPLPQVTLLTGGHDIFPTRTTAFGARDYVIKGQALDWKAGTAILATEMIAEKHVEPGKGRRAVHGNVVFERNHAGDGHFE